MTKTEAIAILTILRTAYPTFYKSMSADDIDDTIRLWATMFSNDPAQVVTEAVKSLISTLKFPPTIADVKEKISLITKPQTTTELEAWGIVVVAIQNSNYHAQEYYDALPVVIKRIIGSPNQLREWAMMESDIVNSVIQSNFMRSYTARVKSDKEYDSLPDTTKVLIETLKRKMLEVGDGKD